eukprot:1162075-Pelagomonas_calceolata.AAC.19
MSRCIPSKPQDTTVGDTEKYKCTPEQMVRNLNIFCQEKGAAHLEKPGVFESEQAQQQQHPLRSGAGVVQAV